MQNKSCQVLPSKCSWLPGYAPAEGTISAELMDELPPRVWT